MMVLSVDFIFVFIVLSSFGYIDLLMVFGQDYVVCFFGVGLGQDLFMFFGGVELDDEEGGVFVDRNLLMIIEDSFESLSLLLVWDFILFGNFSM